MLAMLTGAFSRVSHWLPNNRHSQTDKSAFVDDSRAVSSILGFIVLFGLLVMLLAMYQTQIVPQQNAHTEFQHNQEVQNDLIELRNSLSTAGQADKPTFSRVNLGPNYETRVVGINPAPAAGTLRTSESYNITISNREDYINVSTRFIEYEPRYNEITTNSIWLEHSVLYVDERDEQPVQILEDQNIVSNQSEKVRLTALQNEFESSGTERTKIELFPTETVNDSDIPTGELDVIIPTRLNKSEYWAEQLGESIEIQEDFHADGVHRLNMSNSTVHSDNFEFNTVGMREMPLGEQPKQNVGPTSQRGTGGDETSDDSENDNGESDSEFELTVTNNDGSNQDGSVIEVSGGNVDETVEAGNNVTVSINSGEDIQLDADPGDGASFDEWIGDVDRENETDAQITVTMNKDRDIAGNFSQGGGGGNGQGPPDGEPPGQS